MRFKSGGITNNFYPTLYGVGMLGNTESSLGNNMKKPSYLCWKGMMARCYDPNGTMRITMKRQIVLECV